MAMVPNPQPSKRRKSRRLLIDVNEFISVQQNVTEGEEALFLYGGFGGPLFLFGRRATEGEGEPEANLLD